MKTIKLHHEPMEECPVEYCYGPIEGSQEALASWLWPDGKRDRRRLHQCAKNGMVWVVKINGRWFEAWFCRRGDYERALHRKAQEGGKESLV